MCNSNKLLANIVYILHCILIISNVYIPLSNIFILKIYHVIFVPFIFLHWYLNDNRCCLTILEKRLRNIDDDNQTFFHNFMGPIYTKNSNPLIIMIMIVLWLFSLMSLLKRAVT